MALETLKHVKKIGNFPVIVMDDLRESYPDKFNKSGSMDYEWFEKEIRLTNFIYVRNDKNSISFTIQNGPIKENGINGCQIDTLIETAKIIIEGLQKQYPCTENEAVIGHLNKALISLGSRHVDRTLRKVEGKSQL